MGAPDLLHYLRGAGLVLTLTPAGGLHVAPREALTDEHRIAIRAELDGLVLTLQAEGSNPRPTRRSGNPLMTPEQGDACHAGCWDDVEIQTYSEREARFSRLGRADSEHLAERLVLRDRERDDRRLCLECCELVATGHCAAARRGGLHGADPPLKPDPNVLARCAKFRLDPVHSPSAKQE